MTVPWQGMGGTSASHSHHKNGLSAFCVQGADEYQDKKEVWSHHFQSPAHTHNVEGRLRVFDVAAVACNAGVAARVLRRHIMDHQGAILEDVHPARGEATVLPSSPAPGEAGLQER